MRELKKKKTIELDPTADPEALAKAEAFLDEGGSVAKSFRDSLEAGGVLADDVMRVSAAMGGALSSGLTRNALAVLVMEAGPKVKGGSANGNPVLKKQVVLDVFDALLNISTHLTPHRQETVKVLGRVAPVELQLTAEEIALIKKLRAEKK